VLLIHICHIDIPRHTQTGGKLTQMGAPCRSLVQNSGQLIGNPGTQVTALVGQWFSVPDVYNISLDVPALNGVAGGPLPTHFTVKSINAEVSFVNPSSLPMIYDVYDIVARKDVPNSATLPSPALDVTNPIGAWHTGLLVQSLTINGGGGSPIAFENELGSRPIDSQLFNDYFRILKHTPIVLPQAATHIHKVNVTSNRVFDRNEIALAQNYLNGLANTTQYTIVICRGSVGMETSSGLSATTTLPPMLRYVTVERYTYSYLQASGSSWQFKDSVPKPTIADAISINLNNPSTGVPTSF